jgi:hypothetical protein
MSRPESALYVAVNLVAPFLAARSRADAKVLLPKVAKVGAPALAILGGMLLLRFAYYGHLVPNTYFVKGQNIELGVDKIAPLWGQGAGSTEAALWVGGSALLVVFGYTRRCLAPAASVLACLYFTSSVIRDWMPSLRHLLPVTVLAPIGWAVLVDEMTKRTRADSRYRLGTIAVLVVLIHASYSLLLVDNRYSPEEKRNRAWVMQKTREKWRDTKLAYRRKEPPHVTRMRSYEMGQISQCWGVLETSAEAVDQSWFVGRDIGAVGYYTHVKVFDTAGLFTPAVSMSREWVDRRVVSDSLVRTMMARRPVAGEIYEGWEKALGARPELLEGYKIRFGTMTSPYAFIATDRTPPSRDEVLRRYAGMRARFPQWYHLHTLYGEAVGAVIERRARIVEEEAARGAELGGRQTHLGGG